MLIRALKITFSKKEREEISKRIDRILDEGILTQGENVKELEEKFAAYIGKKFAIAVNSGSSAIELPLKALGVTGKQVIIPANTFFATAASSLSAGASVQLADIEPRTLSISIDELKNRATKKTVGVILVHIGGIISPEIEAIRTWCTEQGYWLFEDAAHAHGSRLHGQMAGSFGIASSFSFFATKVMTAGEGGMIVTDDENIARLCASFRNYGRSNPLTSYHTSMGGNYRMSEITAAVALSQLSCIEEKIEARERIASKYTSLLSEQIPNLVTILPGERSSWYKYIVLLPDHVDRGILKKRMKEQGVELAGEVYDIPLFKQPVLKQFIGGSDYPQTEDVSRRHICLPIYPSLTEKEAEFVVTTLVQVLANIKKN